jgi:hypothetical protein
LFAVFMQFVLTTLTQKQSFPGFVRPYIARVHSPLVYEHFSSKDQAPPELLDLRFAVCLVA